jgi:predicted metal-dependent phosphoesterase TrpH
LVHADLHLHSSHSDGYLSPVALVDKLVASGVKVAALTDHDTIAGWTDFSSAARKKKLPVITGIELSTVFKQQQIHLLGYGFDPNNAAFNTMLEQLLSSRKARMKRMLHMLQSDGYKLDVNAFFASKRNRYYGRPDLARFLMQEGIVDSPATAFRDLIGNAGKYYIPNQLLSIPEGIKILKEAGARVFLAHPALYLEKFTIDDFKQFELDGIELFHPRQRSQIFLKPLRSFVQKNDLQYSGGSDFHGRHGEVMGLDGLSQPDFQQFMAGFVNFELH